MEIREADYHLGVWFGSNKKGDDVLVHVLKREGEWKLFLRFRYRKDDKIFDSDDRKTSYSATYKDHDHTPEQVFEETVDGVIKKVEEMFPDMEYVPVGGDTKKLIFVLAQQEWANIKILNSKTPEGQEEIKKLQQEGIING